MTGWHWHTFSLSCIDLRGGGPVDTHRRRRRRRSRWTPSLPSTLHCQPHFTGTDHTFVSSSLPSSVGASLRDPPKGRTRHCRPHFTAVHTYLSLPPIKHGASRDAPKSGTPDRCNPSQES